MQAYISAIGTATPEHSFPQRNVVDFMAEMYGSTPEQKRMLSILYRATGIRKRHTVLPDFLLPPEKFTFFPTDKTAEKAPTVGQRMKLYRQEAPLLATKAVKNLIGAASHFRPEKVTHLITVSCTGMYNPGLDIDLINALDLSSSVDRIAVNFMGCYGVFNALKAAQAICVAHPGACVLVVSVELCTIHFQQNTQEDNVLSSSLFADGAGALLIEPQPAPGQLNLELDTFHCELLPQGRDYMAWHIADHGFDMVLSSFVPLLIEQGIEALVGRLMEKSGLHQEPVSYYAIHPGGKKILEAVETALQIPKSSNEAAYNVLAEYGNMSSATIVFVLRHLLQGLSASDAGKRILSVAFGPGLTVESMTLTIR